MTSNEIMQKYLVIATFVEDDVLTISTPMEITKSEIENPYTIFVRLRNHFINHHLEEVPDEMLLVKNDVVKHHFVVGKDY